MISWDDYLWGPSYFLSNHQGSNNQPIILKNYFLSEVEQYSRYALSSALDLNQFIVEPPPPPKVYSTQELLAQTKASLLNQERIKPMQ